MQRQPNPSPGFERPNCPYIPGFTCEIRPHTPPEPFGCREYPPPPRPFAPDDWLRQATQTQVVLNYPPFETENKYSTAYSGQRSTLRLIKSVSIGNARGPQLVLCTITPSEGSPNASQFTCMAKVYDGLYYPFVDYQIGEPDDVCLRADQDYSREVAAYEQLRNAKLTGRFAPEYYGSWTMNLPRYKYSDSKEKSSFRPVRLVLMEAIQGNSMRNMFSRNDAGEEPNGFHYSEKYRLGIMAQILDGTSTQIHAGVDQNDLYPRNIIIAADPSKVAGAATADSVPRVVLVDYDQSIVFQRTKKGLISLQKQPLPPNPRERWYHSSLLEFAGWVPTSWHLGDEETTRLRNEWLEETFCGEKKGLYETMHPEDWD